MRKWTLLCDSPLACVVSYSNVYSRPVKVRTVRPKRPWNVVLLDITLPGKSGLELLKELKVSWPKLPVLVLSAHAEDQFAVRVLKAGASGYMTKESAPEELSNALAYQLVVIEKEHRDLVGDFVHTPMGPHIKTITKDQGSRLRTPATRRVGN